MSNEELTAKIYCVLENSQMFINIRPRQKWQIKRIGTDVYMMRDCITIRTNESTINHIFGVVQ